MQKTLILLFSLFFLVSCGTSPASPQTSDEVNEAKTHTYTTKLLAKAHTPTPESDGRFSIRTTIEDGEVNVGDTIELAEKAGRNIKIDVQDIADATGKLTTAKKGQTVTVFFPFDFDKSMMAGISKDVYLVEVGGRYPSPLSSTGGQMSELLLRGKINGQDWEGKSMINHPPYYKYGSRAMLSPDRPIFKMGFARSSDASSVNFDLKGELKIGIYTRDALNINFSDATGTNVYSPSDARSDVSVTVIEYTENGTTGRISGKITGTIDDPNHGKTTLDLEWKDANIDVWGEEAK